MGKKYFDTKDSTLESSILSVWAEAAKKNEDKLDPVNKDAVKKKFDDRKDKDIDNDGDVDSSDKFLHKRRKAVSKAMKDEGNAFGKALKDAKEKGEKTFVVAGKTYEVKEEVELDEKVNTKGIQKAVDAGKSMDVIMTMFANKRTTNTDEIRKVVKDYMWKKRMKKEEVELDEANLAKMSDDVLKSRLSQMEKSLKTRGDSPAIQFEIKRLKKEMKKRGIQEEVGLDEKFMSARPSSKEVKMAIGIANDPRYKGGNMTGAVKAIEKIRDGLSKYSEVEAALRKANENLDEGLGVAKDIPAMEVGTDRYREYAVGLTPGENAEFAAAKDFKVASMKEALAKVWGLDEKTLDKSSKEGYDEEDEELKPVKGSKTMTGGKIAKVDTKPKLD